MDRIANPGGAQVTFIATDAEVVTPSDTTVFTQPGQIYVGATGDVAVKFPNKPTAIVFVAVQAGTILPVYAKQVMATGTTATNLLLLKG